MPQFALRESPSSESEDSEEVHLVSFWLWGRGGGVEMAGAMMLAGTRWVGSMVGWGLILDGKWALEATYPNPTAKQWLARGL